MNKQMVVRIICLSISTAVCKILLLCEVGLAERAAAFAPHAGVVDMPYGPRELHLTDPGGHGNAPRSVWRSATWAMGWSARSGSALRSA